MCVLQKNIKTKGDAISEILAAGVHFYNNGSLRLSIGQSEWSLHDGFVLLSFHRLHPHSNGYHGSH